MLNPVRASWAVKGFANHYRIKILYLLNVHSELSVGDIAERIKTEDKNASQHLSKMAIAGLIVKRHDGAVVRHALTERGKKSLQYLQKLN